MTSHIPHPFTYTSAHTLYYSILSNVTQDGYKKRLSQPKATPNVALNKTGWYRWTTRMAKWERLYLTNTTSSGHYIVAPNRATMAQQGGYDLSYYNGGIVHDHCGDQILSKGHSETPAAPPQPAIIALSVSLSANHWPPIRGTFKMVNSGAPRLGIVAAITPLDNPSPQHESQLSVYLIVHQQLRNSKV